MTHLFLYSQPITETELSISEAKIYISAVEFSISAAELSISETEFSISEARQTVKRRAGEKEKTSHSMLKKAG